jgi:hypothetical protein
MDNAQNIVRVDYFPSIWLDGGSEEAEEDPRPEDEAEVLTNNRNVW